MTLVRGRSHARAEAPLRRLRELLLGFALFTLVLVGALAIGADGSVPEAKAAVVAGLAALGIRWVRALRRGRLPAAMDLGEVAVVLAAGIVAGPPQVLGLVYVGLYYRSLYGSRGRVVFGAALYAAAHLAAIELTTAGGGSHTLDDAVVALGLLALSAGFIVALRASLARHERAAARERRLHEAGRDLLRTTDRAGVASVVAHAAVAATGSSRARATVAVGHRGVYAVIGAAGADAEDALGRELTLDHLAAAVGEALHRGEGFTATRVADALAARLPFEPRRGGLHIEPLLLAGELRGLVSLAGEDPIASDEIEMLRGLAAQAALALETRELADRVEGQRAHERVSALLQNASDVITVLDAHGCVVHQTTAVQRVLGQAPAAQIGRALLDLVHPDDRDRTARFFADAIAHPGVSAPAEWRMRRVDDSWCWLETIANSRLDDPTVGGLVLTSRDVTDRKGLELALIHQAFHDPLTGLANRELLHERLDHGTRLAGAGDHELAVLLVDIDDFRAINDSHGRRIGDRVLMEVARRLRESVTPTDTIARLSGDEFAIVLEHREGVERPSVVAQRLLGAVRAPLAIDGERFAVAVSIGVVPFGSGAGSAEELLRDADIAMHEAKRRGKARCAVFEPGLHRAAVHRLNLRRDLRQAIERDELVLHYQPVVRVATGETTGLEALVRWDHPDRGLLAPGEFIGLAEEEGLIGEIGGWVLDEACRQARRWQLEIPGCEELRIGINVSGRQLDDGGIVARVGSALRASGLASETLVLEVTESAMAVDTGGMIKILGALHELGPAIAIDDFGTGYSSLSYLRHLPVQTLKLAREFVDGLDRGGDEAVLAHGIIELGHRLGLSVVAEGIERQGQLDQLARLDCDWAQGFHLGAPVGAGDTERHLRDQYASMLAAVPPSLAS